MRDTTSSVPDVASRGVDCAAPSQSSEIPNSVTSVSRPDFASAVAAELIKARSKFPGTKNVTVALAEELGELSKALLDHSYGKGANDAVYAEAVQVAAMAQRVAEEGDPGFPYEPPPLPKRSDFIRELLSPDQQKTALAFLVRIHDSREIVLYAPDFGQKVKRFLDEVAQPLPTWVSVTQSICRNCGEGISIMPRGYRFDWIHMINNRFWCQGEANHAEPRSTEQA